MNDTNNILNIIKNFINSDQMKYIDFRDIFYNHDNFQDIEYNNIRIKQTLINIYQDDKYLNIRDEVSNLLQNYYEINEPNNPNRYIYMNFKDLQKIIK